MKIIILIPIAIIILISGCIEFFYVEEGRQYIMLEEQNHYIQNDLLPRVTFKIPKEINTDKGIFITFDLTRPDDSKTGTYSKAFHPPADECFIETYAVVLYYPGMWHIDYEIHKGYNVTGKMLIDGTAWLFVNSNETSLAVFDVISFDAPSKVHSGETFDISFTIKNTGFQKGKISAVLFNGKMFYDASNSLYKAGYCYWSDDKYLDDDDFISHELKTSITEDTIIVLKYNDKELEHEIECS